MKIVEFTNETKYIEDFLKLPKKLYLKKDIVQNEEVEKNLILEKHCLNKYFKQYKVLLYSDVDEVIGRCILTTYDKDEVGYVGFFECIEDNNAGVYLLEYIGNLAKELNLKKLNGPVDSSFWIKYRFKMNNFENRPYTSEPYNKSYYKDIFKESGYVICNEYVSNHYVKCNLKDKRLNKYKAKWEIAKEKYEIVTPTEENFLKCIEDIYLLVTELYSNFPMYKSIAKEDFIELYKDIFKIADLHLFKIAYYQGEPVAFMLGLPDYSNLLYNLTFLNKIKIIATKIRAKKYIGLYMAVKKKHILLGRYFVYESLKFASKKHSSLVGALISSEKPNTNYLLDKIKYKDIYCLFEKNLTM